MVLFLIAYIYFNNEIIYLGKCHKKNSYFRAFFFLVFTVNLFRSTENNNTHNFCKVVGILLKMKIFSIFYIISIIYALDLGFSQTYYRNGDLVDLLVNKVESDHTQLPFGYYDLPFVCPPGKLSKPRRLSLGEILRGDRSRNSEYQLKFGEDAPCVKLCFVNNLLSAVTKADWLIKNGYVVHWSLDGLPGATTFESDRHSSKYYAAGFPLGFVKDDISYIYNHVMLVIRYHREKGGKNSIVGFEVYPKSVSDETCPGASKNYKNFPLNVKEMSEDLRTLVPYTYSVYWREDKSIDYDSRWDLYYENESSSHHIHWISFINSIILLSLLSLIAAVILVRALKKDIQSSSLPTNHIDTMNSWKSLVNEVTNPPKYFLTLSILVAGGIQVLVSSIGVIFIFVVNTKFTGSSFFNNHQGAFFSFSIFCFVCSGFFSSFFGILLYKVFNNDAPSVQYDIPKMAILSTLYSASIPCFVLSVVLFLNLFVWAKESSSALPFGTIVVLLFLIFAVEVPLGLIGGIFGNRLKFRIDSLFTSNDRKLASQDLEKKPTKKKLTWLLNKILSVFIFGLIPFLVAYVELLFIFNSIWLEKTTFYYMYGFLFLTTIILIIAIAESSIIATYVSLANYNNPDWQWLCFRVGSAVAWYIYGYSIYYFVFYLNVIDFISAFLYFSYMALASILIGISFGAVGVITGLIFVRTLYTTIKVD